MIKILVVDDDKNLRNLVKLRLSDEGFAVDTATNGLEAWEKIETNKYNLIIVDIMMPVMNGLELIKKLRANDNDIPAIIVSAKGEIESKIEGFSIGVDDYMIKPIDFKELVLRIYALLRRSQIIKDKEFEFGNCIFKYNELSITDTTTGQKLILPPKEFYLAYKLFSYPDKVFSKDDLFDEFWGENVSSYDDTVKTHICNIRNKLSIFDTIDICTVRGVGYYGHKKK